MDLDNAQETYRISCGTAAIAPVSLREIASFLGIRSNSRRLQRLFEDVRRGPGGTISCIHAAHLLLKMEHEKIDVEFDDTSARSVATIFWHAYAGFEASVQILGHPKGVERLTKNMAARIRLADQLTGRPNIHRFLYRSSDGQLRTALDAQTLAKKGARLDEVIDLQDIARRLCQELQGPLLTLRLKAAATNDTTHNSSNSPEADPARRIEA